MLQTILCVLALATTAQDTAAPADAGAPRFFTAELHEAVDRGFAFLAAQQNRDGSFGTDDEDRAPHIGVTALAGLAHLAAGHLPGRGPEGRASERTLEAVLAAMNPESGLIVTDRTLSQPMYSHAFATLYLAQAYGVTREERVGAALRRAVDRIVASQNPEGGWRYFPGSTDADLSVTACQISALRAARNAGVAIPPETIDRALAYVLACRRPDGSFRYQVSFGHASFHLSAAAVTALHQLGLGDRAEAEAGFEWIGAFFPAGEKPVRGHFLYGQLYALQAAYYESADAPAAPGASPSGDPRADTFDRWAVRVRDHLLERQREDGAFDEPPVGDLYGTAMALLVLQLPRHSLPILIR